MVIIAQRMLNAAAQVDETGVAVLKRSGPLDTTHTVTWSDGVSVGTVEIEAADDAAYAGTWAPVATVVFSGVAPKQDYVRVPGTFPVLRHRISVPVNDGGTVTSRIDGSA